MVSLGTLKYFEALLMSNDSKRSSPKLSIFVGFNGLIFCALISVLATALANSGGTL